MLLAASAMATLISVDARERPMARAQPDESPHVKIAASLGGIFIPVVALVVIFTPSQAWILIFIAFAFALLGAVASYYAARKK